MTIGDATAQRILELCHEQNMSVHALCDTCAITQSTLNNIISGRNKSTTILTIHKICKGLNISIELFFHSELFQNLD